MKFIQAAVWTLSGYIALVLIIEGFIWRLQPPMDRAITLFIKHEQAHPIKRVVYGHLHDGALYVSSNHWFRSWYWAAVQNPDIKVLIDGSSQPHTAIRVEGQEHTRVLNSYSMGFFLRLLCGFAPSKFLRLEPVSE